MSGPDPVISTPSPSAAELLGRPLLELVFEAAQIHREHHSPNTVQCSQLISIKTGGCPEDCNYCSQSAHFETPVERQKLMDPAPVIEAAKQAKANGADRFCMGAAWREIKSGNEFDNVLEMVREVKALGLTTCVTLGMVKQDQADRLREAGLDYYNHNLDTGRSHYDKVVTTRSYEDRLDTLQAVRNSGIKVCCGGILGLGEDTAVRAELLDELAAMDPQPESVPINSLVPIDGTPLGDTNPVDWSDVVRTIAAARILMPKSDIRLSAGRQELGEAGQALAFMGGANSIFVGDELLTTPNPSPNSDAALFQKLGLSGIATVEAGPTSCEGTKKTDSDSCCGACKGSTQEETSHS